MSTLPAAFYERLSETGYRATSATGGPWGAHLQHGGPPAALLATTMARRLGNDAMQLSRIVVDFLGQMPVGDVEVEAQVVRPGRRIALVEARMSAGGRDMARAAAWFAERRANDVPATERVAPPPLPAEQEQIFFPGLPVDNYAAAMEWRFVTGSFYEIGPAAVWARARIPLLPGEPLTPVQSLLLLVDSANGISAQLPHSKWLFMPLSLQVAFVVQPTSDWIHMDAATAIGPDGIGVTSGRLYDQSGQVATVTQALFVSPRTPSKS